jgi:RHS repeat-associated protein
MVVLMAAALHGGAVAKDKDKGKVDVTLGVADAGYTAPAVVTLSATAASSQQNHPVVQVQFFQGATLVGSVTQAPYVFNWSNVAAGNYVMTATATNDKGDATTSAPVTLNVNAPPSVSVTMPGHGASYTGPATIPLGASAADSDGTITRVDFFNGNSLLGTATSAPYAMSWTNVAPGNYAITARATDNQGASALSAPVAVNVNAVPTVSVTAPGNNASYTAPAGILLSATAADSDGSVAKVEFYQGAALLGTVTSAPYVFNWTNVGAGHYTVTARATDNQGASATSAPVAVHVNAPPTVSLTAPSSNARYISPAVIALAASATDTDGTIARVDFFQGTTLLGTATSAPYAFPWSGAAPGNYTITARATDNQGAASTSAPVSIVVVANQLPTVALTVPADQQTFIAPASLIINAVASDSDGTIARVEFYQGSTLLASLADAPYTYHWTQVAAGSYAITARASDNLGGVSTSAPVTIVVAANQLPAVSLSASPAAATAPATITLSAAASDADGMVAKVEFFNGSVLLGTASRAPYTFSWTGVAAGEYALTAKATDDLGGASVSSAVTVKVTNNAAQVYYIHSDHLNSPRLITDAANKLVWQWDQSDPFGNNVPASGTAFEFNLRFPGQYFDRETNLFYNYFREYDPSTGRYIESDPIGLAAGPNTYAYVANQPTRYTDPLGLCPWCIIPAIPYIPEAIIIASTWWAMTPPRGLPPEGVKPPIPDADQCKPGPASRPGERDKGGQSNWDPRGGEWRWFPGDRWHNPHWDYNPHDAPKSPWENIPHGDLPPVKPTPDPK